MGKKKHGTCCICGIQGPLTLEHIPPATAFNQYPTLINGFWDHPVTGETSSITHKKRAGNAVYTLCEACNNFTGGEYGTEYAKFAYTATNFAKPSNEGQIFSLILHDVKPLRIFKQVLSMLCSTCGPGFVMTHPTIQRLILNKYFREPISPLKLYCYIRPSYEGTVSTGIFTGAKLDTGKITAISEVSWWPLGWVLTYDNHHIEDGFDVSHWWQYEFDESLDIFLDLPCRAPIKLPFENLY